MHHQTQRPTCPHCNHELTADEMTEADTDLFALAPTEETAAITCPICDKDYWVKGGYTPHYTSAFVEEEF